MRYFLDTEFIESPCRIDLISIGIVSEDKREYYAVSNEFDASKANDFVKSNVLPELPPLDSILWKTRDQIKQDILDFIGNDYPEFWAHYGAYDWVAFCWLFGPMADLPKRYPMYFNELQSLISEIEKIFGPIPLKHPSPAHEAISDARWNWLVFQWIRENMLHKRDS